MWFYTPSLNEHQQPWVGRISASSKPNEMATFEFIRHVELKDLYSSHPIADVNTLTGKLDFQDDATLVYPIVQTIDPGTLKESADLHRTIVSGSFLGLLRGLAISEAAAPIIETINFSSDSFFAWLGQNATEKTYDSALFTDRVEVLEPWRDTAVIPEVGTANWLVKANVSTQGNLHAIEPMALFSLTFDKPISLNGCIQWCMGLEQLFGFLIGHRGVFPIFNVYLQTESRSETIPLRGSLQISGQNWKAEATPHRMNCIHLFGWGGGDLETILVNFNKNPEILISRIKAVELTRFFTADLVERFKIIVPALEQCLKERFIHSDEANYLGTKQAFLDWIETSENSDIREFSRKHVSFEKEKAPGLKTQFGRAIDYLNGQGFNFPRELSSALPKRRGRLVHTVASLREEDITPLKNEIDAATMMLMLFIFDDLGIDIRSLARNYFGWSGYTQFLNPRETGG